MRRELGKHGTSWMAALLAVTVLAAGHAAGQDLVGKDRGVNQDLSTARRTLLERVPEIESYDVLLLTIDDLRPIDLGCYGAERPGVSPALDQLAKKSFRFTNAFASSPHRQTAVLSLLFSQYPSTISELGDTELSESAASQFSERGFLSFAHFRSALTKPTAEPVGKFPPNLDFAKSWWNRSPGARIENLDEATTKAISYRRSGEPMFGWLHASQTHPPARKHPGFDYGKTLAEHRAAALSYVDQGFARVWETLVDSKLESRTIIVVTSPTGFSPDRDVPRNELSDVRLRVPLLVHVPGMAGGRVDAIVETIDILPSLLSLVGRKCEYSVQGRSFLELLLDPAAAGDRLAYAEHLFFDDSDPAATRRSVRDGRWRLIHRPSDGGYELHDTTAEDASDRAADQPDVVARLRGAMDEIAIYNDACVRLWRDHVTRAPVATGTAAIASRARWLAARGDPQARGMVRDLIRQRDADRLEAADLLMRVGTREDLAAAELLVTDEDWRVRALAGAFLARHGGSETALDHAISGLRPETSTTHLVAILDAISMTGSSAARVAVQAFTPREDDTTAAAWKDLTLARLGDAEARHRLARHVLAPNAAYSKTPFIESVMKLRPDDAPGLLRLCLTDGDRTDETVLSVLDELEKLDDPSADQAVAVALGHPRSKVRLRAARLLRKWGSQAGYRQLLSQARGTDLARGEAVGELLSRSALIGSPALPGVRFDRWLDRNRQSSIDRKDGRPHLSKRELELAFNAWKVDTRTFVLAFEAPGVEAPETLDVLVRCNDSARRAKETLVTVQDGVVLWVGELPSGALEPGTNKFEIRVRDSGDVIDAWGLAAFLLPRPTDLSVAAALDTSPLLGAGRQAAARSKLHRDHDSYRVWYSCTGAADVVESGRLRVTAGDEVLAEVDLDLVNADGEVDVKVASSMVHGEELVLRYDGDGKGPPRRVTAVLFAD